MKKVELEIVAISHSVTQTHNFAVVLGEKGGVRRLPVVIGGFEAQAIAIVMEKMVHPRPLTHDLFKNALETFNIDLKEIVINNLLDGIFYARLVCEKDGEIFEIDSRTSDAIAMAVRFGCPIYTYAFILESAGVVLEEEIAIGEVTKDSDPTSQRSDSLVTYPINELENMLQEALEEEDYEQAAKIRDEINRRKKLKG